VSEWCESYVIFFWEAFRSDLNTIRQKDRKSSAGAKAFDLILMFKILVL
jgi:hypothetical protein